MVSLTLRPLYPGDSARYQMKRRLDVNQSNFGSFGKEKSLAAAGNLRSFGCLARRLVTTGSDYAIPSPVVLWKYSKHERSTSGVDYLVQLDECCLPMLYFQHAIDVGHCTKWKQNFKDLKSSMW